MKKYLPLLLLVLLFSLGAVNYKNGSAITTTTDFVGTASTKSHVIGIAITEACLDADDDFTGDNGSEPSSVLWTASDGCTIMDIQSNKLHFGEAGTRACSASVTSKWTFPANSNFDIQVDFDVTTLDAPDSGQNQIAYFRVSNAAVNPYIFVARYRSTTVNGYTSYGSASGGSEYAQADASGKLRFVMSGCPGSCVLKFYNWYDSQWEWNGSTDGRTCTEDFSSDAVVVRISFAKEATVGSTTIDANDIRSE